MTQMLMSGVKRPIFTQNLTWMKVPVNKQTYMRCDLRDSWENEAITISY